MPREAGEPQSLMNSPKSAVIPRRVRAIGGLLGEQPFHEHPVRLVAIRDLAFGVRGNIHEAA